MLPYTLVAALLVATASGVVVLAIKDIPLGERGASASAARSSAPARGADLSSTGRLAWWRAEPESGAKLWVANVDGTLRRAVAQIDDLRRVSKTRWTPDGSAIAYVDAGAKLVVVRLDGTRSELRLADTLVAEGRRIADQRWSKSGAKVAATVQRTFDGRSDVWIAKAGGDGWNRATELDDALAAEWLDDSELLVNTTGGVLGVLRDGTLNAIRPLTGLSAGAPFVGDDGRVWFLAGRASAGRSDAEPMTLVADAALWSVYADGSEPRLEQRIAGLDDLRLDGRWPDGRVLVHRGTAPVQLLGGFADLASVSSTAGLIERVVVAQDKRSAIAFTRTRIIRLDLSKPGTIGSTVLFDPASDADAWFPSTIVVARPAPAALAAEPPAARYVFALGGALWSMDAGGNAAPLRVGTSNVDTRRRIPLPLPAWSPKGDLLLTTEFAPRLQTQFSLGAVTIGRSGQTVRLAALGQVGLGSVAWSPDGTAVAAISAPAGLTPGPASPPDAELEIQVATLDGSSRGTVAGREVAWSKSGLYVLSNGLFDPASRSRTGQTVEVVDPAAQRPLTFGMARRPLVTVAALLADPRAQVPAAGVVSQTAAELTASPDGTHVGVRISYSGAQGGSRFIVALVRAADGQPTAYLPGEQGSDLAWSPARATVGYTASETRRQGSLATRAQVATIVDAASGETLAKQDGRFAGWSPDGAGYYVARDTGLYFAELSANDLLRIGPVGVPVSATAAP